MIVFMAVIIRSFSSCHQWQECQCWLISCHYPWQAAGMQKVAVVVQEQPEPFGLGALCEVWAEPYHPEDDNPVFDFTVCAAEPGRIKGASGFDLFVEHGLEALRSEERRVGKEWRWSRWP